MHWLLYFSCMHEKDEKPPISLKTLNQTWKSCLFVSSNLLSQLFFYSSLIVKDNRNIYFYQKKKKTKNTENRNFDMVDKSLKEFRAKKYNTKTRRMYLHQKAANDQQNFQPCLPIPAIPFAFLWMEKRRTTIFIHEREVLTFKTFGLSFLRSRSHCLNVVSSKRGRWFFFF